MYKRNYSLEEKETTFQYKYNAPLDFHSHSLMNLNVESRIAGKESRHVKGVCEGRECKRNMQYNPSIVYN